MEKPSGGSFAGSPEKGTRTKDDREMTLNRSRHFVPGYHRTAPLGRFQQALAKNGPALSFASPRPHAHTPTRPNAHTPTRPHAHTPIRRPVSALHSSDYFASDVPSAQPFQRFQNCFQRNLFGNRRSDLPLLYQRHQFGCHSPQILLPPPPKVQRGQNSAQPAQLPHILSFGAEQVPMTNAFAAFAS
jgi:hypothetical protein